MNRAEDPHDRTRPDSTGRYERSDIPVRAVLWFGVGVLAAAVIIHLGLDFLLGRFSSESAARKASPWQWVPANAPREVVVPAPFELDQRRELRASEDRLLGSYGWTDVEAGTVHIPIDRAMDLLVERGVSAPLPRSKKK
ncbi:MAG: hypothetical protein HY292_28780 [Planctomycetes bacterium]|nr:hypothetical protein [Planctomycetota bacterium]